MPGLTGPQSEAVQRRSQGGPVHAFSLLGLRDSSHRGASTEQRTSRFMVPGVPHRAEHCKGHTESAPGLSATEQGWGGSSAASRFLIAALGERERAPAGTEKGVSASVFAARLFWDLELQHINVLMPELLFKVAGPKPEQAMGSQSEGLQWASSFSVSPWCWNPGG